MKISLEFKDLRDLLYSLPKLGILMSDEPYDKRIATALDPTPETMTIQITPVDGTPFTVNEKEALRRLLLEFAKDPEAFTRDPKTVSDRVINGLKADGVIPEKAPWAHEADAGTWAPGGSTESEETTREGANGVGDLSDYEDITPQEPTAAHEGAKKGEPIKNTPAAEKATESPTEGKAKVSGPAVRAAFNDLLKNDRRDAVKKILTSFGAANFSGLKETDYTAAVAEARKYLFMSDEDYKEALKK